MIQLLQVAVLARILMPEDYGLMAMTTVVISFATVFSDFGLNSAYLQRREVSEDQRSTLYWGNVLLSGVITAALIALSSPVSILFGDERLAPLITLSTASIVIAALGQQLRVKAEKDLNFRPLVLVEIMAGLAGLAVAIILALRGQGVYALVWGTIANATIATLLAWTHLADGWRPAWRCRLLDIKPFLGFGGSMVGNGLVSQINMNIDIILGSRIIEATQLGHYSLPRGFVLQIQFLVNSIITRVGFPVIAEIQHNTELVKDVYLRTINLTASVNAPLYLGLIFFAPEVVLVLFGANWSASEDILRLLALWGLARSIGNPVGSLLLGMGRADLAFKWNIARLCLLPPVLWLGARSGIEGLALALALYSIAILIPTWYVLVRPLCHAGMIEYFRVVFKPIIIALLTIGPVFYMLSGVEGLYARLACCGSLSVMLYLTASYLFNRSWFASMIQLLGKEPTG